MERTNWLLFLLLLLLFPSAECSPPSGRNEESQGRLGRVEENDSRYSRRLAPGESHASKGGKKNWRKQMVMMRKSQQSGAAKMGKKQSRKKRDVFNIDKNNQISAEQREDLMQKETLEILHQMKQHQSEREPNASSISLCDPEASTNTGYQDYFQAMRKMYPPSVLQDTCVPQYESCGWPRDSSKSDLPLLVIALGAEGSGHHTWMKLLQGAVDCMLKVTNQYKYRLHSNPLAHRVKRNSQARKELLGYPHLTPEELNAFMNQFVPPNCGSTFDSLDSFPFGMADSTGRMMNHPDLVNLHQLDGVIFRLKYLILVRNATSGVMSTLGRKYVKNVDVALRTTETVLTYMDVALRGIPCHKTLVANFEHVQARPGDIWRPLAEFLELQGSGAQKLRKNLLEMSSKSFRQTAYDFTYLGMCGSAKGLACREKVMKHVNEFFLKREYMWPTFSGRGDAVASS